MLIRLIWNEFKKEFFTTWSYKWQWCGEFISLLFFFLFLRTLSQNAYTSVEYCIWFFSILLIGDINGKISTEMRSGTFEQMCLSCVSISKLFICKAVVAQIRALAVMSILFIIMFSIGVVDFAQVNLQAFASLIIITPGLYGISLVIGGATVLFKEMGWVLNVVNNSILFLSGIFIPLESFPEYIQRILLLIPTTQAINILHLNNLSLTSLCLYFFLNVFYFLFGLWCFWFFEKMAKLKGVLGHH